MSLEIAILAPALLLLVFSIVQGGLWFHARNLAQAAAQEGAAAGAAYHSTTGRVRPPTSSAAAGCTSSHGRSTNAR